MKCLKNEDKNNTIFYDQRIEFYKPPPYPGKIKEFSYMFTTPQLNNVFISQQLMMDSKNKYKEESKIYVNIGNEFMFIDKSSEENYYKALEIGRELFKKGIKK